MPWSLPTSCIPKCQFPCQASLQMDFKGGNHDPFQVETCCIHASQSKKICAKFCIYSRPFFLDYGKNFFRCLLVGYILRRKTGKLPYLDTRFLGGQQNKQDFRKCLLSSLIWFFPLVDGCHCGYITKLKKKTLIQALHKLIFCSRIHDFGHRRRWIRIA